MAQDNSQYSSKPKEPSANTSAANRVGATETTQSSGGAPYEEASKYASELACRSKAFVADLSREAKKAGTRLYNSLANSFTRGADGAIATVGEKLTSASATLRKRKPADGKFARAVDSIASRLDGGGRYLMQHRARDIGHEVTDVIRRNPLQSITVGLGVGVLIGAASTRRSRR